jgi:hypothetical protein
VAVASSARAARAGVTMARSATTKHLQTTSSGVRESCQADRGSRGSGSRQVPGSGSTRWGLGQTESQKSRHWGGTGALMGRFTHSPGITRPADCAVALHVLVPVAPSPLQRAPGRQSASIRHRCISGHASALGGRPEQRPVPPASRQHGWRLPRTTGQSLSRVQWFAAAGVVPVSRAVSVAEGLPRLVPVAAGEGVGVGDGGAHAIKMRSAPKPSVSENAMTP